MSELPEGWVQQPLTNIVSLKTGPFGSALKKSDYRSGATPVVNPMHITGGKIFPTYDMTVTPQTLARLSEFRLAVGDVVMGRRGEMGRCAVINEEQSGWLCGSGSFIVRPTTAVDSRYLQRFLSSPSVIATLTQSSVGSTMVNLNQEIMRSLVVPLPPLAEQKRIADKLDALLARVDRCRARLDRVPLILKRFRQAVLAAATSGQLTEDWREERGIDRTINLVRLEDTGSAFSYGSSTKSSTNGLIPVLRMGNIQNGKLDWRDLVFTSDLNEIAKYELFPGDVLFNRTNSPELVGKTAVYKGERPAIYAGYLIRVKCSSQLLPDYLNYCLNSPEGRDYCWRVKSDGVSQSNINAKKLAAFEFDLPPLEEQHEIVRRVETLLAYADRLALRYQAACAQVERLTPALLAKAFRGELVAQDPADEPAALLLDRLRGARAGEPRARAKTLASTGVD